jgi:hypothetical protein
MWHISSFCVPSDDRCAFGSHLVGLCIVLVGCRVWDVRGAEERMWAVEMGKGG